MHRSAQLVVAALVLAVLLFLGMWLYRVFFPGPSPLQRPELRVWSPQAPRVVVLNASGMPPVGRRVAKTLRHLGYSVRLLAFPGETLETSVILDHRSASLKLGRKLQETLEIPVASYDPDPGNPADATVVLGKDALSYLLEP